MIMSCFFAFSIIIIIGKNGVLKDTSLAHSPHNLLFFFDQFFVEFFVLLLLGNILLYRRLFWRVLLYILSSAFIVIYAFQLISLHYTKDFISSLAIDNIDHLYLFLDWYHIVLLLLIFTAVFLSIFLTENGTVPIARRRRLPTFPSLLLVLAIVSVATIDMWLPGNTQRDRSSYATGNLTVRGSPIISLGSTLYKKSSEYAAIGNNPHLTKDELSEISNFGFHYNHNAPYPLIKNTIYQGETPFLLEPKRDSPPPNVIVIFSEGLSARAIGAYGSVYSDLTPYIDDFSQQSMVVERYYNHTAATYRGLHGQLASTFPLFGGAGGWHSEEQEASGRSYLTLADLFRQRNYETVFLDSHHQDHRSRVDEMMAELGFETILTGDELAESYLDSAAPLGEMAYSDQQYFDSVVAYLKNRMGSAEARKPLFLSLYNFGTHAFLNHSKDGYRYHSYNNVVLNNTHNFDFAFGQLWNYIKTSPYSKNTVVVFTADHCHFHEFAFLDAFSDPDYEQKFVDRIPLIIHDPTRILPPVYDAGNSSSIDFAPTMAHYFGLENVKNPFMGKSIFERKQRLDKHVSVAALGPSEVYLIDGKKIHRFGEQSSYESTLKILDKYIAIVRQLELENRIWDDDLFPE